MTKSKRLSAKKPLSTTSSISTLKKKLVSRKNSEKKAQKSSKNPFAQMVLKPKK